MLDWNWGKRLLAVLAALLPLWQLANAQGGAFAVISNLNTQAFPNVEAFLDVHDATGGFVSGLQGSQVNLIEDGNPVQIETMEVLRQGVQFVVVLNPGPSFGVRDSKGKSRYDFLTGALEQWAKGRQGTTLDDLSLLITGGPSISHTTDSMKFASALQSESVNARQAIPSLDTLYSGVNVASDPTPRPGMGRAVLFITPPLEGQDITLENLIAQAREQGVIIFVWMVTTNGTFSSNGVQRLNDLASQTGGWVFTYTGEETLPNPEDYLTGQREIYRLTYISKITTSGSHQLHASVILDGGIIETAPQNFEITLLAPVPAFVSPPIQIQRKPPADIKSPDSEAIPIDRYIPQEQSLQIIFDFPDGRKRPLVKTSFFVDGVLVAENTAAPFDQFTWSLSGYGIDGSHQLKIQATDSFGLTGESVEIPVSISILQSKPSPWFTIQRNLPTLAGLAVILSGAILLLVLIIGGQLRPVTLRVARLKTRKSDPVTQPIHIHKDESATRTFTNWVSRLHWPQPIAGQKVLAFLHQIDESGEYPANPPIAITSDEITIGRDPNLATLVLIDPSVEGLHARLTRQTDSSFRLADAGSVAGTWINYSPISREGARLEHGDLLHIGRICFRFNLRQPTSVRKPVIIPSAMEEDLIEEPTR